MQGFWKQDKSKSHKENKDLAQCLTHGLHICRKKGRRVVGVGVEILSNTLGAPGREAFLLKKSRCPLAASRLYPPAPRPQQESSAAEESGPKAENLPSCSPSILWENRKPPGRSVWPDNDNEGINAERRVPAFCFASGHQLFRSHESLGSI